MLLSLVSLARLGFYLAATIYLGFHLRDGQPRAKSRGMGALGMGFLLGAIILAWRAGLAGAPPLLTRFDVLGLFAFTVTAAFLILLAQNPIQPTGGPGLGALGAVILPVPLAALALGPLPSPLPVMVSPALRNPYVGGHIVLFFLAYSALLLGFGVGVLYLLLERQLKLKKLSGFLFRLPSLGDLDRIMGRSETLGFLCLTAAIAVAERGFRASGLAWALDPKMAAIFLTWAVYGAYLLLRHVGGWRGHRSALLSVSSFILVLVSFFGIEIVFPGHGSRF